MISFFLKCSLKKKCFFNVSRSTKMVFLNDYFALNKQCMKSFQTNKKLRKCFEKQKKQKKFNEAF
jgi:hypothetical protein